MSRHEEIGPFAGGHRVQVEEFICSASLHRWQESDGTWSSEAWTPGIVLPLHFMPLLPGGVAVFYNQGRVLNTRTSWAANVGTLDFTPEAEDTILCEYPR